MKVIRPMFLRRLASLTAAAGLMASMASSVAPAAVTAKQPPPPPPSTCNLGHDKNPIQHVIYIQFDNTHFLRDNPNVPSDLEQMPHLLNFIKDNGTLLANDHTALISHTQPAS